MSSIGKLLATGVGYCLTNDDVMNAVDKKGMLSFSTAFVIFKTVAQAIGPELMGGFNEEINYQKLRTVLSNEHPDKINHDLSNLLKDAAVRSVGFVKKLYLEKITKEQETTLWNKIKLNPFKIEKATLKNMQSDLDFWMKDKNVATLLLEQPENCLDDIINYFFEVSAQNQNQEKWIALRAFFKEKLPYCFDLAFKEALKENQKGRIAFQIWIWQDIQKDLKTTKTTTEAILKEVQSLKLALENNATEPANSLQFQKQITQSFEELNDKFEGFCVEIIVKLDELLSVTKEIKKDTTEIKDDVKFSIEQNVKTQQLLKLLLEQSQNNKRYTNDDLTEISRLGKLRSEYEFKKLIQTRKIQIDEIILPNIKFENDSETIYYTDKPALVNVIESYWGRIIVPHIFLTGEGGAGKTYALYSLWRFMNESKQTPIPVYIDLIDLYDSRTTLLEKIVDFLNVESYLVEPFLKQPLVENFPNIILILDRLNQVNNIDYVLQEIHRSENRWNAVQIIVTSRKLVGGTREFKDFNKYSLKQVSLEQTKKYLEERELNVTLNFGLDLLRNPLRLTLYTKAESELSRVKANYSKFEDLKVKYNFKLDLRETNNQITKGDLMWNYFQITFISEIIDSQSDFSKRHSNFLLQKFLPIIAYYLYKRKSFRLSNQDFDNIILNIKKNDTYTDFQVDDEFKTYFDDNLSGKEFDNLKFEFIDFLNKKLDVIQNDGLNITEIEFSHHEYRDFFAAKYIFESLKKWISHQEKSYESIPDCIKGKELSSNVKKYISNIDKLGSNFNAEATTRKSLDLLRKKNNSNLLKYSITNLFDILSIDRQDLTLENFSFLYLKGQKIFGKTYGKKTKEGVIAASFENSILDLDDLLPSFHEPRRESTYKFHENDIFKLELKQEDGKQFIVSGTQYEIIEWDIKTGKKLKTKSVPYIYDFELARMFGGAPLNDFIEYCPIEKYLDNTGEAVTVSTHRFGEYFHGVNENLLVQGYYNVLSTEVGWLGIWDIKTGNVNRSYDIFKGGWYCISEDGNIIATTDILGNEIQVWDDIKRKGYYEEQIGKGVVKNNQINKIIGEKGLIFKIKFKNLSKCCAFHPILPRIIIAQASGKIEEYDFQAKIKVMEYDADSNHEFILGYTPDGKYLITSNYTYTYISKDYGKYISYDSLYKTKGEEFGNLTFWGCGDGKLKYKIQAPNKNLIKKIAFNFTQENIEEKDKLYSSDVKGIYEGKYFVTAGQNSEILSWSYETFEIFNTISPPIEQLKPIEIKHIPFTKNYMVTYQNGYIKFFVSEAHICLATKKGDLTQPQQISFNLLHGKAIITDYIDSKCELWDIEKLERIGDSAIKFENLYGLSTKLNSDASKIVAWGESQMTLFNTITTIQIYDINNEKIVFYTKVDFRIAEDVFISPNDKYLIILPFIEKDKLYIVDIETDKLSSVQFEKNIKSIALAYEPLFLHYADDVMLFSLIFEDNEMNYLWFEERNKGFRTANIPINSEQLPNFNKHYLIGINDRLLLLFEYKKYRSNYDSLDIYSGKQVEPMEYKYFTYDLTIHEIKQICAYVEPVGKDNIMGDPYCMNRAFDFDFVNNKIYSIIQLPNFEYYTLEQSTDIKDKVVYETQHRNSLEVEYIGCKLPYFNIRHDIKKQRLSQILEKVGAYFPQKYYILNFPYTYDAFVSIRNLEKNPSQKQLKIQLFILRFLGWIIKFINLPSRIVFNLRKKNKKIRYNPNNPYPFDKPISTQWSGGKYYESVEYDS